MLSPTGSKEQQGKEMKNKENRKMVAKHASQE